MKNNCFFNNYMVKLVLFDKNIIMTTCAMELSSNEKIQELKKESVELRKQKLYDDYSEDIFYIFNGGAIPEKKLLGEVIDGYHLSYEQIENKGIDGPNGRFVINKFQLKANKDGIIYNAIVDKNGELIIDKKSGISYDVYREQKINKNLTDNINWHN